MLAAMPRLGILAIGLIALAACRDRGREAKQTPATAGSGSSAVAAPEMPSSYARLLGSKPATLGPTLAGFRFGEPVVPEALPEAPATGFGLLGETEPRILKRPAASGEPRVLVNLEIRAGTLFAFRVELLTEQGSIPGDSCAGFAKALEARWGPAPARVWVDRDAKVRAALQDTCILTFERYTDVASWIGPEPSSIVPVSIVGKSPSGLASRVGPGASLTESMTLRDVGLGEHAVGPTTIDVYLHEGLVSGLGVEAAAGEADRAALRERISSAFAAKPTRDSITGYDVWPTKVPIRMLETPRGVRVEVGNLNP